MTGKKAQTDRTTEQKRREIMSAVESGKFYGRQLDPTSNGAAISKLKQGKPVSPDIVERIYRQLAELLSEYDVQEVTYPQGQSDIVVNRGEDRLLVEYKARIEELQDENARLKEQVEQLSAQKEQLFTHEFQGVGNIQQKFCSIEARLVKLEQYLPCPESPNNKVQKSKETEQSTEQKEQIAGRDSQDAPEILGYRLKRKKTYTNGRQYEKWYATKGASRVVYIGADLSRAEKKIRAYEEKQRQKTTTL